MDLRTGDGRRAGRYASASGLSADPTPAGPSDGLSNSPRSRTRTESPGRDLHSPTAGRSIAPWRWSSPDSPFVHVRCGGHTIYCARSDVILVWGLPDGFNRGHLPRRVERRCKMILTSHGDGALNYGPRRYPRARRG